MVQVSYRPAQGKALPGGTDRGRA